jgi:proline racemase
MKNDERFVARPKTNFLYLYAAIIPEVTGSAHIMGINQLLIDPDDPHRNGFLLG